MVCCKVGRNWFSQVHKELRETMAQLEAIRHEMRTGISIMNPGPMTSQVLKNAVPGLSAPVQSSEKGPQSCSPFRISECFEIPRRYDMYDLVIIHLLYW